MRIDPASIKACLNAMLACSALWLAGTARAEEIAPVVRTQNGSLEGAIRGNAAEFLGIPYAAPPTGPLRWRAPEAPAPWTGIRSAKAFGPACAQISVMGGFAGPPNSNEDCLYLNIVAPKSAVAGQSRLPVFVWIHGGGYVNGSGDDYDGRQLAVRGNAVVVTINYRLNLLGFLAHPALDKEGHLFGNYAILDQQFALQWVKANIANFGGDPDNVTLGGQSAGGSSTGVQLISPLAKGLFHKAIIASAGSYLTATPLEVAQARGVAFAKAAGCGEGTDAATAACLRSLPASTIQSLAGSPAGNSALVQSNAIRDGQVVPSGASSAFAQGRFNRIPVMNGTVRDEGGFFTGIEMQGTGTPPWKTITQESVTNMVKGLYGVSADAIFQHYPAERYRTAQLRSNAIQSDAFICKSWHATQLLADKVPLYTYEFRDRTAPSYFPAMPGYEPLAYHTAELQYLFPGFHGGTGIKRDLNARQQRLSGQMVGAFMNFVRTGNPNGTGSKPWPTYRSGNKVYRTMEASGLSAINDSQFAAEHQCAFWATILTYN